MEEVTPLRSLKYEARIEFRGFGRRESPSGRLLSLFGGRGTGQRLASRPSFTKFLTRNLMPGLTLESPSRKNDFLAH